MSMILNFLAMFSRRTGFSSLRDGELDKSGRTFHPQESSSGYSALNPSNSVLVFFKGITQGMLKC